MDLILLASSSHPPQCTCQFRFALIHTCTNTQAPKKNDRVWLTVKARERTSFHRPHPWNILEQEQQLSSILYNLKSTHHCQQTLRLSGSTRKLLEMTCAFPLVPWVPLIVIANHPGPSQHIQPNPNHSTSLHFHFFGTCIQIYLFINIQIMCISKTSGSKKHTETKAGNKRM